MQSIIIASYDPAQAEEHARALCLKEGVGEIDITIIQTDVALESKKQSIGIARIRELKQTIFLRPISGNKKAVVILNAHTLTIEAQNAMLKILEEPPPGTILILVVNKKDNLLPTIISRCTFLELSIQHKTPDEGFSNSFLEFMQEESKGKLRLAQDIGAEKNEVLNWIENAIQTLRKKLIEEAMNQQCNNVIINQYVSSLKSLQKTYLLIQTTNVNPRLIMENLLLGNS